MIKETFIDENRELISDELVALQSIYPELELDGNNCGRVSIPVSTEDTFYLSFPDLQTNRLDTIAVKHFPAIELEFFLRQGYPQKSPPVFFVKSSWLPMKQQRALTSSMVALWNEIHDCVLFDAIELLRSDASSAFQCPKEMVFPSGSENLKQEFLATDKHATLTEFESRKFVCLICFDQFNGKDCFQLSRCGHVCCKQCLTDYYSVCVEEGMFSQLKCVDLECAKTAPILSLEEMEMIVGMELTKRFQELDEKRRYENDTNIVFCPRKSCQGPARRDPGQKLAICLKCDFAFCSFCQASWHGDLSACRLQGDSKKLVKMYLEHLETDKDKAEELEKRYGKRILDKLVEQVKNDEEAERWALLNGQRCPTCDRVVERIDGCCHMICLCGSHFCFLCGAYLMIANPYIHFNDPSSTCYAMLFASPEEKQRFSENWL
ncbi:ubiquitin-protein ligase E3 involved in cytoplasmic translational termination [Schizosaccharomyces osmophilus]|uniref:RBR-type E3 ubiquitin transferase n=1 Tax=Schizosaccharomyces osmophilus TaxID=2545709 RepID=A0AAE9WB50_9SCHI|nr:ubiquitin-protein ligase E3 involved in cytoplasmic translational termination [Schizosaccharomyces osmophilus]WBW72945.1 ubiquitin-protein ligase E3 involved in cytoplasmic translational termination [Schizosaccharomyces osmophilus]